MNLEEIYIYIVIALIIVSLILIMALLFKRKIKKSNTNIINKKDTINYLMVNYPKINFDVSILNKKLGNDIVEDKIIIVENLVSQYCSLDSNFPNSAPPIEHEHIWETYIINAKPPKGKVPPDIKRRKEALLYRDKHTCQRCSKNLSFDTQNIYYLKSTSDGGDYNLENMMSVCSDCHKILLSNNIKKTMQELELTDKLYSII